MLNIEFENNKDAAKFLRENKKFLLYNIFTAIKEANENNYDFAMVGNIIVINEKTPIIIEKNKWLTHLNTTLSYFLEIEEYEICSDIRDLINIILYG